MTIRRIIIVATVIVASTTGLLVGCAVWAAAAERRAANVRLDTAARVLVRNLTPATLSRDSRTATEMLASAGTIREISAVAVYLPDGRLFSSYRRSAGNRLPSTEGGFRGEDSDPAVVHPLTSGRKVYGTLYVIGDRSVLRRALWRARLIVGGAGLLSLLIAAGVALLLQRRIIPPIRSMSNVALSVASHQDYTMRARTGSLAEIRELGTRFNAMISDFNARDADLRRSRWQLEEDVVRRTAELTGVNTLLSAAKNRADETARINADLRARNESILQSAAEGIFGLDAQARVTFINRAGAEMLGWEPQQVVGQPCHAVHDGGNQEAGAGPCALCKAITSIRSEVAAFRTRGGAILPVEYTSRAMHSDDSLAGLVVTFRDISERLALETMKAEFVATVSHELRTPLTSIRGALGLLVVGAGGEIPGKAKRMVQIALTNADRLIRLVNDILDVERAAAGRLELELTKIVAGDLMRTAVDVMQAMADQAGVRLEVGTSSDTIEADSDRMIQALTNLISNAIKFSPPGKQVTLSAVRHDDCVVFAVADEGRGIPPEKLALVFERFKQVDASDSRDKGGSGLGLAIVRGIVEAHEGRIWVDSTPGAGSTFFIAMPVSDSTLPGVDP